MHEILKRPDHSQSRVQRENSLPKTPINNSIHHRKSKSNFSMSSNLQSTETRTQTDSLNSINMKIETKCELPNLRQHFPQKTSKKHAETSSQESEKKPLTLAALSAYNTIRDINSTHQVNKAIKLLDSVPDRVMLIDKVVERRNEKIELEESMNINRLHPLLDKLKDKLLDSAVHPIERKGRKLTFVNLRRPPSENFEGHSPLISPTPSKFYFAKSDSHYEDRTEEANTEATKLPPVVKFDVPSNNLAHSESIESTKEKHQEDDGHIKSVLYALNLFSKKAPKRKKPGFFKSTSYFFRENTSILERSPGGSNSSKNKGQESLSPKQDYLKQQRLNRPKKPSYSVEKFLALEHIESELTHFLSKKDKNTINLFLSTKNARDDGIVEEINNRLKKNFSLDRKNCSEKTAESGKASGALNSNNSSLLYYKRHDSEDNDGDSRKKKELFKSRAGYKATKRQLFPKEKMKAHKFIETGECNCLQRVTMDMFDKREGHDDESFISLYESKLENFYKESQGINKRVELFTLKKELEDHKMPEEDLDKKIRRNQKRLDVNSKLSIKISLAKILDRKEY